MDKPRRRAQHLQLVHSEPATSAPMRPPRRGSMFGRAAIGLGVLALGILVWTRASDMPQTQAPQTKPSDAPPPQVAQSFPEGTSASARHISDVLAFDVLTVDGAGDNRETPQFLEPGGHLPKPSQVMFRLYNRTLQGAFFILFGVGREQGLTFLYPPARAGGVNRSLPLAPVPLVELPEPVTLVADAQGLTLVGVFTDAPVTTDEVKQAWQRGGEPALQDTLHAHVQTLKLTSTP